MTAEEYEQLDQRHHNFEKSNIGISASGETPLSEILNFLYKLSRTILSPQSGNSLPKYGIYVILLQKPPKSKQ